MAKATTPKTDTLKKHRASKAEKQQGLKSSATDAPDAVTSTKTIKQAIPLPELSALEQAANDFYDNVTKKEFKSARKKVVVPAFIAGSQWAAEYLKSKP